METVRDERFERFSVHFLRFRCSLCAREVRLAALTKGPGPGIRRGRGCPGHLGACSGAPAFPRAGFAAPNFYHRKVGLFVT